MSNHGPFQNQPLYPQQTVICEPLSVTDIERLAKAGVTIAFDQIAGQVRRDDDFPNHNLSFDPHIDPYTGQRTLEGMFWDRWRRANDPQEGTLVPLEVKATQWGETIYVMVSNNKVAPVIIEDPKPLYPSDALMAKVALMEK